MVVGAGLALVLGSLALLGIAQLLPSTGVGLAVRLAAALVCVLLVPGALAQRALGQPSQLGVAIAGALMWSLGFVALGLAITFALGRSLSLTLVVVGAAAAVSLGAGIGVRSPDRWRIQMRPVALVVTLGLLLGVSVWWVSETIQGDGLFHLGRVRKLDELAALESVGSLNEFADGGLHPGYAFPVWHAVLALVARLADVDASAVVQYGPALLVPLALVVTYAAGQALFGSWAGGVATVGAQVGLVALSRGGVGSFELLTLPAAAARLLLVPALLALVFAYLREPRRALLPALMLGALSLTIVHGSYMVFVCLLIGGYAAARLITERRESLPDLRRVATIFIALLVPFAAFLVWLAPVLRETASVRPDASEAERALERYAEALVVNGDWFRLSSDSVARGGVVAIVAFLALGVFVLAMRRRHAALVVGGALAMLAVALVPPIFTEFSELISLSQARRLPAFLPLAFALAGGALVFASLARACGHPGSRSERTPGCVLSLGNGGRVERRLGCVARSCRCAGGSSVGSLASPLGAGERMAWHRALGCAHRSGRARAGCNRRPTPARAGAARPACAPCRAGRWSTTRRRPGRGRLRRPRDRLPVDGGGTDSRRCRPARARCPDDLEPSL